MRRQLSRAMLSMLASNWNVAHPPRKPGRGFARCLRGCHYENAIVHDALILRGLTRESSKNKYTRLTALGMRVLGVKANQFRWIDAFKEWPGTKRLERRREKAEQAARERYRELSK